MQPQSFTGELALRSARHPWLTLAAWIGIVLIAAVIAATVLGSALTQESDTTADLESIEAMDLIDERLNNGSETPAEEFLVVTSDRYEVAQPEYEAFVGELAADIGALNDITSVATYYDTGAPSMVSADSSGTMLLVTLVGDPDEALTAASEYLDLIEERQATADGFEVRTVGQASLETSFNHAAEKTLQTGEAIGIGIALIVLVIVFGALVAAGLPLILALVSIAAALGLTAIVGQVTDISFFVMNMIFMIGLAVGIDYVLFIVARYREERERGLDKLSAIARTGDTSSKAILFSGLTVVSALVGMLIIPDTLFFSLGMGAILVVLASLAMTLTLLPAVLSLLGDRINAGRPPVIGYGKRRAGNGEGVWDRTSRFVMRHPAVSALVASGLLLGLGAIALTMNLGFSGISTLPDEDPTVQAYTIIKDDFVGVDIEPVQIVIDAGDVSTSSVQSAVDGLLSDLEADGSFGPPTIEVAPENDLLLIEASLSADAQSNAAISAVERLRDEYIPAHFNDGTSKALVSGATASTIDTTGMMLDYMPIVFTLVLAISSALLLVAFRSIVIPVKAIIMNLLSVFAAYGLITLVFQHGVGAGLLGFRQVDRIDSWIPLFLFAVLFGLSMDYHIFLLSRIKEHFDESHHNTESVADGLRATGSIITGAALIMVGVFGGFALGDLANFQQMGFGLAAAVVLDATIVRSVLVPASMTLLGDRNWYFPRWLEWLPEIHVEGKPVRPELEPAPAPAIAD